VSLLVVFVQARRRQPHRREVQRALGEHPEEDGKSSGRPGRRDALVGLVLGHLENLRAAGEERREAGAEVEPALVQLHEVDDQLHRGFALAAGEALDLCDQLVVGEARRVVVRLHAGLSRGPLTNQVRSQVLR